MFNEAKLLRPRLSEAKLKQPKTEARTMRPRSKPRPTLRRRNRGLSNFECMEKNLTIIVCCSLQNRWRKWEKRNRYAGGIQRARLGNVLNNMLLWDFYDIRETGRLPVSCGVILLGSPVDFFASYELAKLNVIKCFAALAMVHLQSHRHSTANFGRFRIMWQKYYI